MPKKTDSITWRDQISVFLGRLAAWGSRITRLGSGGMIGGKLALKLSPQLLNHLAQGKRIALVTGTNGKTTTTRMLFQAVKTRYETASNRGGDNMTAGILSALMQFPQAQVAVLEVDEMHLQSVARATKPDVIVLLNLSRDQLDRVGEIAAIEKTIRQAVDENPQAQIVANVDDPLMVSAAWDSKRPVWVAAGKGWNGDSLTSPRTGGAIVYPECSHRTSPAESVTSSTDCENKTEIWYSGNDFKVFWKSIPVNELIPGNANQENAAPNPSFSRPEPSWIWRGTTFSKGDTLQAVEIATQQETEITVNLPGRANRGNALQALVAALALGVDIENAARGISQVENVAGRYAQLNVNGKEIRMLLAKNPAGWMESLTMLNPQAQLIVGVNGQRADGMDLSWLWDVDFEQLRGKTIIATGERGTDLRVRLNYAGIDTLWAPRVNDALEMVKPGSVDMLLNYTAFRDARVEFEAKGWIR